MEGVKEEVKLGELKRENLRKLIEQASAQASSVLLIASRWEELENHFDSVQKNIEKRVEVLELQEKELETAMRVLGERQEEIGLKENESSSLDKKIEDLNAELKLKQEKLCSVQNLISECREKLEGKEKQLALVEEQIQKSNKEIDVKKKNSNSLQLLVEECKGELESKERELVLVTRRVDECRNELCLKDNQLEHLQRSIDEKSRELELKGWDVDLKEKELESLRNSIKECSNHLDMKQKELVRSQERIEDHCKQLYEEEKALKIKKEKLVLIEKTIMERSAELLLGLHSREIEFDSLQTSMRLSEKQLESTKEELDSVKARVRGYFENLELKKQEFNDIQMCIEEPRQEHHLKENQLSSVQISIYSKQLKAEEEERNSIKNSILERTNEPESKKQRLEAIQKSQAQLSDVLESKERQQDLVEKACSDPLHEANVKEKHLGSHKRSVDELLKEPETEQRQFATRVEEFEQKEKQFDSVQKAAEQRSKEPELNEKQLSNALHSQVKIENPSPSCFQVLGTTETVTVNPITPTQIKTEQPEHFMISNANETSSSDLGVAAAMDGKSLQGILNEHFDEPDLSTNEVLATFQKSPDPAKFVLDLMLGTCSQHQKKGETGFEESVLKSYVVMLDQLLQVSPLVKPNVKADALNFATEWKAKMKQSAENSTEIMFFLQFVAAFGLGSSFNRDEIFKLLGTAAQHQQARNVCQALGFTDIIPEFIGSLVERKQYIEAVRFVCAFDSKDKCPPDQLLNQLMEDINKVARDSCKMGEKSPEVQKATDEQIAALKSAIECIKDCKLESRMPVKVIEERIAELEKKKTNRRFSAAAPVLAIHSKAERREDCKTGTSVPRYQPAPAPLVQQQLQGRIRPSTRGTQPRRLSNKRARTVNNPHYQSDLVRRFGLPGRPGHFSDLGSRQFNVDEENYLNHLRPEWP